MAIQFSKKRPIYSFAVLILLATGIQFLGCKKTDDKTSAADSVKTTPVADNTYVAEYTAYRTQTEQELAANRDSISAFKARIKTAKAKAKADLESARLALEKQNADLQAQLAAYKDEGKDKWEKFKSDFNRSKDSVKSKWNNLIEKIKHDDD